MRNEGETDQPIGPAADLPAVTAPRPSKNGNEVRILSYYMTATSGHGKSSDLAKTMKDLIAQITMLVSPTRSSSAGKL